LLTAKEIEQAPIYIIEVVLPNDAVVAFPALAQLEAQPSFDPGGALSFHLAAQPGNWRFVEGSKSIDT